MRTAHELHHLATLLTQQGTASALVRAMAAIPPDQWTPAQTATADQRLPRTAPEPTSTLSPASRATTPARDRREHGGQGHPSTPQQRPQTPTTTVAPPPPAPQGPVPAQTPPVTPQAAPPSPAVSAGDRIGRARPPREPFDYDGTIDGLRGIPLTELSSITAGKDEAKDAARLARFHEYGLHSVYDLLTHVPLRYVDRTQVTPISQMVVGHQVVGVGTAVSVGVKSKKIGKNSMRWASIDVQDASGAKITCSFFNQAWKANVIRHGDEVVFAGKLEAFAFDDGGYMLTMSSPLMDRTGDAARIIPVYPQSAKVNITTWEIHRATMEAVERLGDLADPIPTTLPGRDGLVDRVTAYRHLHLPHQPGDEVAARRRLAYDELLRLQLGLRMRRLAEQSMTGVQHNPTGHLTGQFLAALPFQRTGDQERACAQIDTKMRAPHPMNSLVLGDVGAGKTIVAIHALLTAVEGGWQAAFMAPTEVLAGQHYQELTERLAHVTHPDGRPVTIELMAGRIKGRKKLLQRLADGDIDILVGTHALFSDDVHYARLGLCVVDEQHRFGVDQRAALADKGPGGLRVDQLPMTATPIPRTQAMTVFGDLDQIILKEKPPGRVPIKTTWIPRTLDNADPHEPVWRRVRQIITEGRQAYVVSPLVEDSETKAAAAAINVAEQLRTGPLSGLTVNIVTGKQKPDERTEQMAGFARGDAHVLSATTVIEVGVNVPNAAVIVILEPAKFGMSQLHQLRGRVGRGKHASYCVLAGEASNSETTERLQALVDSDDGFELSEIDLKLRGAGQVIGTRQHGLSDLRVASLDTDTDIITAARRDADQLLTADPTLARRPGLLHEVKNALGPDADKYLTAN